MQENAREITNTRAPKYCIDVWMESFEHAKARCKHLLE